MVWRGNVEKPGVGWGRRYWALLSRKMPLWGPCGPHHLAEASLNESRCQAVHPNVPLVQLSGQVLGEAQQGSFTNIVGSQALGKGDSGLVSLFPVHFWIGQ